jgi:hypothetical protein
LQLLESSAIFIVGFEEAQTFPAAMQYMRAKHRISTLRRVAWTVAAPPR